jgi:hypothetical protein
LVYDGGGEVDFETLETGVCVLVYVWRGRRGV